MPTVVFITYTRTAADVELESGSGAVGRAGQEQGQGRERGEGVRAGRGMFPHVSLAFNKLALLQYAFQGFAGRVENGALKLVTVV